jgi:hypothetical protein
LLYPTELWALTFFILVYLVLFFYKKISSVLRIPWYLRLTPPNNSEQPQDLLPFLGILHKGCLHVTRWWRELANGNHGGSINLVVKDLLAKLLRIARTVTARNSLGQPLHRHTRLAGKKPENQATFHHNRPHINAP